ncbi:MAG: InlB B-repeat-containing protein [Candidatus Contendobacter sp.]|nr:InlB B-repeat-containing protein [Candidatus Contendobacter sp.]
MDRQSQGGWNEFLSVCAGLVGIWLILYSGMANAVFTNGDFGTGDFSGWTQQSGANNNGLGSPPSINNITLSPVPPGTGFIGQVISGSPSPTDPITSTSLLQYGTHVAQINGNNANGSIGDKYAVSSITQTAQVAFTDVDPIDLQIHIRFAWNAVLEEPGHLPADQPFFFIAIENKTKSTTLYQVFKFADPNDPIWTLVSGSIVYSGHVTWLYSDWQIFDQGFPSNDLAPGDQIKITAIVGGCAQSGHGGYVYLAGFGSNIPRVNYDLTVTKIGTGTGTVTSSNLADINCGTLCKKTYVAGTKVTLTATPNSGFVFTGWSNTAVGCGMNPTCILTMDAAKTATAAFSPGYFLTVTRNGTGAGIVTSSPSGISCGNDCKKLYASGASIVLTATPLNGSTFTGWGGACSGTATTCTVTMTAAKTVTATFTGANYLLTVNKTGNGKGTIKTGLPGINCDINCITASYAYARGTRVTFIATPLLGTTFTGWSGACTGTVSTCMVTMDNVKSATANFKINTYVLKVVKAGTAAGTITSDTGGINCGGGGVCTATYDYNTSVILTAAPATTKRFTGWTGACRGTATTCTVPMTAAKTVTATFVP